jgi:ribokinase
MRSLSKVLGDEDIVHISGLYMLPKLQRELPSLLRRLHRIGAKISFDPGWNPNGFNKTARQRFYRLLSFIDFYEPNDAELKQLTGETSIQSAKERLRATFHGILALKLGRKGSKIVDPLGKVTFVPSYPTRVADTTGAGDVFDAGFFAGVLQDLGLDLCIKYGNAAASIAISRNGEPGLRFPNLSEVRSVIKDR